MKILSFNTIQVSASCAVAVSVAVRKSSRIMRLILRTADLKPKQEHPLGNPDAIQPVYYAASVCRHVLWVRWSRNRQLEWEGSGTLKRSKTPFPISI